MENSVFNFLVVKFGQNAHFQTDVFSFRRNHYFEVFLNIYTIGKNKSKLKTWYIDAGNEKYTDAWERFPVQATEDWAFQKDMTEIECEEKLKGE